MKHRLISLVLVIVLFCTILIPASAVSLDNNRYTIDTPYTYPVLPGTDEWNSLSMDERIALSHVNEGIVEDMTTEAVLITTLQYPFIINIFAYSTVDEGIEVVKEYCSSLEELLIREDALLEITAYLNTTTNTESVEYYVAEKLWEYVNASTAVAPRYVIDPATGLRVFYVETPNGSSVPVFKDLTWDDHGTTYEEQRVVNSALQDRYGVVSVRDINPSYNCHSYAWHSTSASNDYWMNNPYYYINDGSYVAGTGAVGDRITYNDINGKYIHSGIVTSSSIITSKWGALGLFEHTINACPYYVQAAAIYCWQRA